jgi:hypothetical protein
MPVGVGPDQGQHGYQRRHVIAQNKSPKVWLASKLPDHMS